TNTSPGNTHPKVTLTHEVTSLNNSVRSFILKNPNIVQLNQRQLQQLPLPNSSLIRLDTIQLCQHLGNQTCIMAQKNFKVLLANMTKDVLGNWILFGKVQNNSSMPLSQVYITMYLYDSTGNLVGLKQGSTIPQSFNPAQN